MSKSLTALSKKLVLGFLGVGLAQTGQTQNTLLPRTRTYFIAADEVEWNYTPHGRNLAGLPHSEGGAEEAAGSAGVASVVYHKAIYREYTDASFSTLKVRPPQWDHLGILGPLVRAEVGDTVLIVFKNQTKLMCTMHPHGLAYDKNSEGALYNDGTAPALKNDDAVPPGAIHKYSWSVPERAGPAHGDLSSIIWMYHSHFMESQDMNTGLIGPIIINARGSSKPDGSPKDVDREFVTSFAVFDESLSLYNELNIIRRRKSFPNLALPSANRLTHDLIYTINGLIEGNVPTLTMKLGEHVRWYMFANTNPDDVHTPHWHGETAVFNHMRVDTIPLTPMGMATADMVASNVGTWLFHCHVTDHFDGGMVALFTVIP